MKTTRIPLYHYLGCLCGALFVVFLCFEEVHAYRTTDQNAFTLDGRTGIYTIEYSFGHGHYDVYMPSLAQSRSAVSDTALSYTILDDEDEIAKGTHTALILSNATYQNGMYIVPKGVRARFTLLIVFTPSDDETESHFRAEVTHLPFRLDETHQKLNPSELDYYTSPTLHLEDAKTVLISPVQDS